MEKEVWLWSSKTALVPRPPFKELYRVESNPNFRSAAVHSNQRWRARTTFDERGDGEAILIVMHHAVTSEYLLLNGKERGGGGAGCKAPCCTPRQSLLLVQAAPITPNLSSSPNKTHSSPAISPARLLQCSVNKVIAPHPPPRARRPAACHGACPLIVSSRPVLP